MIDDNNTEMAHAGTQSFGIEYRCIEPKIGLEPELRKVIALLDMNDGYTF